MRVCVCVFAMEVSWSRWLSRYTSLTKVGFLRCENVGVGQRMHWNVACGLEHNMNYLQDCQHSLGLLIAPLIQDPLQLPPWLPIPHYPHSSYHGDSQPTHSVVRTYCSYHGIPTPSFVTTHEVYPHPPHLGLIAAARESHVEEAAVCCDDPPAATITDKSLALCATDALQTIYSTRSDEASAG